MRSWLTQAWRRWTGLSHHIGNFQARLLLTLIYFTWLVPFAVLVRMFSDPLDIRGGRRPLSTTAWKKRAARPPDLPALRSQF